MQSTQGTGTAGTASAPGTEGAKVAPIRDLRDWIARVEAKGDLEYVEGADWDLEIGAIVDLWPMEAPALMFDKIKGYPPGFRVLTNSCTSIERIALTLHSPAPISDKLELVRYCRRLFAELPTIEPRWVSDGPVFENSDRGEDVDLFKFPSPRWHEGDGGRFIGTGSVVIQQDPDTGWVNLGTYRIQVHDSKRCGIWANLGKHGQQIMQKYWDRGQPCPVAVSVGHDPLLLIFAGLEMPYELSEYAIAGGVRGEPVDVVAGPVTGLPVPAGAEIVLEGFIPPGEEHMEGPFGEWMGYYGSDAGPKPVIHVEAVHYRHDPIILGFPPGKPPCNNTYFIGFVKSAAIWDEVERAGVPGIVGVWGQEAGGGRNMTVISIRQMYPGHAKQAGLIASQCRQGAYANRYVIVVDDDIDPTNIDDVIWAMCTRVDTRRDIDIIDDCWTSPVDPMHYPVASNTIAYNSRMIINACRPFERRKTFPKVVGPSPDLKRRTEDKWAALFAKVKSR